MSALEVVASGVPADTAAAHNANQSKLSGSRIASIDVLRGSVMLLMTIDHTRDFFHGYSQHFGPTDVTHASAAIFFTRWITHFCAPVFVFLAGVSIFLAANKMGDRARMARFLLTRGFLLVALEMTVVRFGWDFTTAHYFYAQIIWTLGWCMVLMTPFVAVRNVRTGVLAGTLFLIVSVLFADRVLQSGPLWAVLLGNGTIVFGRAGFALFNYPILRWAAVMLAGYAIGPIVMLPREQRRKWILATGVGLTVAFVLLRWFSVADAPWVHYDQPSKTFLSFLNCTKIPVSLPYVLMTLGPALCLWALIDRPLNAVGRFLMTFGRVPLFFYVLHLYVIHATAVAVTALRGQPYQWAMPFMAWFPAPPESNFGFGLLGTYVAVMFVIAVAYLPCRYFGELKRRRADAWLRYL